MTDAAMQGSKQAPPPYPGAAAPPPAAPKLGPTATLADIERGIVERVCASDPKGHAGIAALPKRELARRISDAASAVLGECGRRLSLIEQRDLVTRAMNMILTRPVGGDGAALSRLNEAAVAIEALSRQKDGNKPASDQLQQAMRIVQPLLMERVDISVISQVKREDLGAQISDLIVEILAERRIELNRGEQALLVSMLIDDMLGLGPLEPLLADEAVNDILVNGASQVYVERAGKLELTGVKFRDDAHVMNIATRIVSRIGRRVDESTPMVDARLADGSRVNIIVPPCALDGPSISIRKFSKRKLTLDTMVRQGNITAPLANLLRIASRCRLNIIISGGTGSGKTTLLNAISEMIDHGERIVTIEDAAELKLQQPHVVRLETRPANLEGVGEITMRDLVKNSLRMRPDRIILGEVRGAETLDMLQAMNTGHDGSMCTVHANNPREALTRIENMVAMSGFKLGNKAVRGQMASAINLIVQISRMRDGMRRITHIVEVVGMEEETILTQELFKFEFQGEQNGRLMGTHVSSQLRPYFITRAEYYGLDRALMETMSCPT
ncbi:MAG: CpaF family protein [Alphaproteobacteria bacterium]